jgi:cyanate permease
MAHAHPDPHTHVDRVTDVAAVFLGMLVGIVGAIGALTGTVALRHSLYSAGAAIAVGVALIAIAPWVHRMDPKTFFVALLSGMALAVGWLLVRSRRRGREH